MQGVDIMKDTLKHIGSGYRYALHDAVSIKCSVCHSTGIILVM